MTDDLRSKWEVRIIRNWRLFDAGTPVTAQRAAAICFTAYLESLDDSPHDGYCEHVEVRARAGASVRSFDCQVSHEIHVTELT